MSLNLLLVVFLAARWDRVSTNDVGQAPCWHWTCRDVLRLRIPRILFAGCADAKSEPSKIRARVQPGALAGDRRALCNRHSELAPERSAAAFEVAAQVVRLQTNGARSTHAA